MGPETHQELQTAGPRKGGGACASGSLGARLRARTHCLFSLLRPINTLALEKLQRRFKNLNNELPLAHLVAASALCLSLSIWAASGCFCPALVCLRLSETAVAAALCRACVQWSPI